MALSKIPASCHKLSFVEFDFAFMNFCTVATLRACLNQSVGSRDI